MKFETLWNARRALLHLKSQLTLSTHQISEWSEVGFTDRQISFNNMLNSKLEEITEAEEELSEVLLEIDQAKTLHVSIAIQKPIRL